MATDSIRVSAVIAASPERLYNAWLSGTDHSAMTESAASVEPNIGGRFTAWDGYISGETVELVEHEKVVQTWRTPEFPEESPHSRLEVLFEPVDGGTNITFVHSEIPEGDGTKYEQGWQRFYIAPMTKYFGAVKPDKRKSSPPKPAAKTNSAKKAAPVKTSTVTKSAPVQSAPAKKAAPVKTTTAKKAAPAQKAAPTKTAAPTKAAVPAKAAAPAKKAAAPVKAAAPAKKTAAPEKKTAAPTKAAAAPVKKTATPAKADAKKAPDKAAAPAAPAGPRGRAKKSS